MHLPVKQWVCGETLGEAQQADYISYLEQQEASDTTFTLFNMQSHCNSSHDQ